MALRGAFIAEGYVPGRGLGRVYEDMDNSSNFFVILKDRGIELYVARERVQFRKSAAPKQIEIIDSALTLF